MNEKSDLWGQGYGDSHLWKKGETRQLGSVQNELRGTQYTCKKCGTSFFYHYNMFSNCFDAVKDACVDEHCSSTPNLIAPAQKRLEQLKKEMEIALKPVTDGEYDCLEHVRARLVRDIRIEMEEINQQLKKV